VTSTPDVTGTADVIVVGAGPGGCAAALEAAAEGASVILFEADTVVGGNAARSTGYVAFADHAMQHDAGIVDGVDAFVADMEAEVDRQSGRYGLVFDREQARRFAEESADTHAWLIGLGFRFNRFISRPLQHSVDRMIDVESTSMFTSCFADALATARVDVRTGVRARRLVTDPSTGAGGPRVVGVETTIGRFDARRGVVLAAGGYQANPELRARYQPQARSVTPYLGTDHDRGDGHLMGHAVGGDLVNMGMIPPLVMVASALVEESVAVNIAGCRFHDEAGPYDERVEALRAQDGGRAWFVFDDRTMRRRRQLVDEMPAFPQSAGTLADLAEAIGVSDEALQASVERWNATVDSGTERDPDFGRVIFPDPRRGIVEPPFHAVPMVEGINFPCGGLRVTGDMAVVDVFGRPIPGLFAVGDCAGGLSCTIGLGGMRIAGALVQGRIAGRALGTGRVEAPPASSLSDSVIERGASMTIAVIDE